MARTIAFKTALAVASMLAFSASQAAGMSKDERKSADDRIEAQYKSAREACDAMKDNAKDICMAEAKAKQKVARAELEARSSGKPADRSKVAMTRAEANYEIAKEKCDDLKGNDKDVCLTQAKANETKAKADAKVMRETSEARKDASEDKREADYKAARERCDSMNGEAKDSCVAQVKARFGKG